MNKENMQKVLDFIQQEHEHYKFDMGDWCEFYSDEDTPCHTAACIGGTCNLLQYAEGIMKPIQTVLEEICERQSVNLSNSIDAREWLEITLDEGNQLFLGDDYKNYQGISREEAIAALKYAIEFGKIDYTAAVEYYS